jgi:hypothetical protein
MAFAAMGKRTRERARRRAAERTTTRRLALGLGGARVAIGAATWLVPSTSMRFLGFDPEDAQNRALGRLAGTRDLILGVLAIASLGEPAAMRATSLANAWVDAGDAATFGIALARRQGIDQAAVMGTASATAASVTGFWLANRLR